MTNVKEDDAHKKALSIYLNDHFAGATGGVELAKRAARSNKGSELGAVLDQIASEITEDREQLHHMIIALGMKISPVKPQLAWLAERAGRLKMNGQVRGYSDLSRVVELEGLCGGVQVKLSLWENLSAIADASEVLESKKLEQLADRARSQFDRLRAARLSAAKDAFIAL